MRIASYNMENLYFRDESLLGKGQSKNFMKWLDEFEVILQKGLRFEMDYRRLSELSSLIGLSRENPQKYLLLRNHKGKLQGKILASPRILKSDLGQSYNWVRMTSQKIPGSAVLNKARMISEINPDVLLLQEVEDRSSLLSFRDRHLAASNFKDCYFFEGNSTKGLGFGVLLRKGFSLSVCRSYCNEQAKDGKPLFDTGMQLLWFRDPQNNLFRVMQTNLLPNEGKDKDQQKRKEQADFISQVWEEQLDMFHDLLICCGSLGRPSNCDSISGLISRPGLQNILATNCFKPDKGEVKAESHIRLGTCKKDIREQQNDYLLFNPGPTAELLACGLNRRGIWPGEKPRWHYYPDLTNQTNQASSHPLLWADFLLNPDMENSIAL